MLLIIFSSVLRNAWNLRNPIPHPPVCTCDKKKSPDYVGETARPTVMPEKLPHMHGAPLKRTAVSRYLLEDAQNSNWLSKTLHVKNAADGTMDNKQ